MADGRGFESRVSGNSALCMLGNSELLLLVRKHRIAELDIVACSGDPLCDRLAATRMIPEAGKPADSRHTGASPFRWRYAT